MEERGRGDQGGGGGGGGGGEERERGGRGGGREGGGFKHYNAARGGSNCQTNIDWYDKQKVLQHTHNNKSYVSLRHHL